MGNIIFWTTMVVLHSVNARVWKQELANFWYKLSWFFIGWSASTTLHYIGEYVQG